MWSFETFSDRFYVITRLYFKLDLVPSRETLLDFFAHVRRAYPGMQRFRRRENGTVTLDGGPRADGERRYVRVGNHSLRFGQVAPEDKQAVASFTEMILTHSPYHLSLSDLDYDSLEVAFGFDLEYCGNHDELVAETLLGEGPLQANLLGAGGRVIDCQPCLGFALTADCSTQAYIDIRGRTSMYELRSEEYEPQLLSVRLTVRRYFRDGAPSDLNAVHQELLKAGEAIAANRVVPQIVLPLREAIASRR